MDLLALFFLCAMAAAVAVQELSVSLNGTEETLSVLSFIDRRKRPFRRKNWLLIRGIERLLFGVRHGDRSTGAFAAHLSKCSMADSVMCCEKARVTENTMTQQELDAGVYVSPPLPPPNQRALAPLPYTPVCPCLPRETVFTAMKPLVDPESRNRIRKASVVPLTVAVSSLVEFGRNDCTSAILMACNKARATLCVHAAETCPCRLSAA